MTGESANAGLHLNIKKTKIMTTKEIYNFNTDDEVVKDFVYFVSVVNSNGDCNREIKTR